MVAVVVQWLHLSCVASAKREASAATCRASSRPLPGSRRHPSGPVAVARGCRRGWWPAPLLSDCPLTADSDLAVRLVWALAPVPCHLQPFYLALRAKLPRCFLCHDVAPAATSCPLDVPSPHAPLFQQAVLVVLRSGEAEEEEASPEAQEDIAEGWSRAGHGNSPVESLLLLRVSSGRASYLARICSCCCRLRREKEEEVQAAEPDAKV